MADEITYLLDEKDWQAFMALLKNPPTPNENLIRLMRRPAPWDENTSQPTKD